MKTEDRRASVAQALRKLVVGDTSEQMADRFIKDLRRLGMEITPIAVDAATKRARAIAEHERWGDQYEAESKTFEAEGNEIAAQNRREMARESRARAAHMRGEEPKKA